MGAGSGRLAMGLVAAIWTAAGGAAAVPMPTDGHRRMLAAPVEIARTSGDTNQHTGDAAALGEADALVAAGRYREAITILTAANRRAAVAHHGALIGSPVFAEGDALLVDHLAVHRTGVGPGMTRIRHAPEAWFFAPSRCPPQPGPLAL